MSAQRSPLSAQLLNGLPGVLLQFCCAGARRLDSLDSILAGRGGDGGGEDAKRRWKMGDWQEASKGRRARRRQDPAYYRYSYPAADRSCS